MCVIPDERELRTQDSFHRCQMMTRGSEHKVKCDSPSEDKKIPFYCEGGKIQEEVAHRSQVVSSCGDTENPNRHSPGLPVPGDPV